MHLGELLLQSSVKMTKQIAIRLTTFSKKKKLPVRPQRRQKKIPQLITELG